jgi:phage/plasmid-like protein (TIGR03299 family)
MTAGNTVRKDGFVEFAYLASEGKPWHRNGQPLSDDAGQEDWIAKSGMDFKVQRSTVRFATDRDPEVPLQVWEAEHVFFRNDTLAPVGRGSAKFKLVQPGHFWDFVYRICAEIGLKVCTAGTLYGGSQYFVQCILPNAFKLPDGDTLKSRLLLSTACDGSMATIISDMMERVVCSNTLRIGLSEKGNRAIKVKHSSTFDGQQAAIDMGLLDMRWDEMRSNVEALAKRKLSKAEAVSILVEALGDPAKFRDDKKIDEQPNARLMGEIIQLYSGRGRGSDLDCSRGTAWGLVNACTEFFDHHAGRSEEARISSAWFGKNSDRKADCVRAALLMV